MNPGFGGPSGSGAAGQLTFLPSWESSLSKNVRMEEKIIWSPVISIKTAEYYTKS